MTEQEKAAHPADTGHPGPVLDNIALRDGVPVGWRPIYDRLVIDLYRIDPALCIARVDVEGGQLQGRIESELPLDASVNQAIEAARNASLTVCEDCGVAAERRTIGEHVQILCGPHDRKAQAAEFVCAELYQGHADLAKEWVENYVPALREPPAALAERSAEGLEQVKNLALMILYGSYA